MFSKTYNYLILQRYEKIRVLKIDFNHWLLEANYLLNIIDDFHFLNLIKQFTPLSKQQYSFDSVLSFLLNHSIYSAKKPLAQLLKSCGF